jgi:hypothetical protein
MGDPKRLFGNKVLPNKRNSKAGRRAMGSQMDHSTKNHNLGRALGINDLGTETYQTHQRKENGYDNKTEEDSIAV